MLVPKTSRYVALPFFLSAVCFILLAPAFWTAVEAPKGWHIGRTYENLDLYERVYPFYTHAFTQLRAGALPLWNPSQLCGAPMQGSGIGLFQPLNAVFWILPTERAMAMQAFLGLALMGLLFVLYGRAIGMRYMPAVVGGIVYAFGGATASAMSRPELLSVLAWAPLLFWAAREMGREGRVSHAVAAGIALGLMLLSGAYGACLSIACIAYAYTLLRSPFSLKQENPETKAYGGLLGLGLVIGLGISAAQWLPDLMLGLQLHNPWEVWRETVLVGEWPLRIRDLVYHVISATPDKSPRIGYIGMLSIALLPIAYFHRHARKDAFYFSAIAVVLVLVALWSRQEDARFALELLIFPAHFGLAVLIGLGLDHALDTRRPLRHPLVWMPGALLVTMTLLLTWLITSDARGRVLPLLLAYFVFLIFRVRWVAAVCAGCIGLVLYADLYAGNVNYYRHPFEDMEAVRQQISQVVDDIGPQVRNDRLLIMPRPVDATLPTNLGMYSPLLCANGRYLPLTTEQLQWWQSLGLTDEMQKAGALTAASDTQISPALLDAMAVRVVLSGDSPDGAGSKLLENGKLRYARQVGGVHVYVNDHVASHALWTPVWHAVPGITGALSVLKEKNFNVRRACTVQSGTLAYKALTDLMPHSHRNPDSVPWEQASCRIVSSEAERVEISVDAPLSGITVLSDSFAPGWVAELDGETAPILKVNGLFRGVATPAGSHQIVFRYVPWGNWIGLGISGITCIILIFGAFANLILVRDSIEED